MHGKATFWILEEDHVAELELSRFDGLDGKDVFIVYKRAHARAAGVETEGGSPGKEINRNLCKSIVDGCQFHD
jgi:hypothetical protein